MTERKPPWMSFETWVDQSIREATERGAFDNLPGAGKPIPGAGQPDHEMWWVQQFLRREGVSSLPPTLALRKEVEDALASVPKAPSEEAVRTLVGRLNEKITAAIRVPPAGPPLRLMPLDPDAVVQTWREAQPVGEPADAAATTAAHAIADRRAARPGLLGRLRRRNARPACSDPAGTVGGRAELSEDRQQG